MSAGREIVVVGGGVIGASCAYYLGRAGAKVTIIEQGEFGRGCSHGNCGYVSPSHILPFAGPGAIWSTLKTLLARNSPLKVRFRFDPALWSWFLRFQRRCNRDDMLRSGRAIQALLNSARTLYEDVIRDEGLDVEWEDRGLLFVFRTPERFEHYAEVDHLLREEFGLGAERYDGPALERLEPALKPGLAGAWHYLCDAQLRPDKLMAAWRDMLLARGVTIRERTTLTDLNVTGRVATRVTTSTGPIAADQVVIATGAWTPQLSRLLRCTIPIQPGKGYSMTMPRPARCPTYPMIFEEHRVAITPLRSAYRVGSTMEFAGYDDTLNPDRLRLLREGATLYLHEPLAEPVLEQWWGWRPMTPDSVPLIGPCPAFDNVHLAAGHNMLGLSMGTATGKLVAEMLTGQTPHIDPAPYAPSRWK